MEKQQKWKVEYYLHWCSCQNDEGNELKKTKLLLNDKNEINKFDEEGRTPLHYSSWNGLHDNVRILLENGAMVNIQTPDRKSTPLHFACGMCKIKCVQVLLQYGADKNMMDVDKWKPIDLVKQNLFDRPKHEIEEIVQLLLN